jgi:EAL domain-containing protein (putative c-di-GMP-specific phosphodiesterase class I)
MRHATVTARSTGPGGAAQVYDPAAKAAAADQLELETDMARAVEHGEFFLLYQPLICSRTGRLQSVEALVRWQHPTRGLIPPDAFIGLAERTGLIVPLGLHVLRMAIAQLRAWSTVAPELSIAVNVSARQLVEPDFVEQVRNIVWSSGVDPHKVILELTESMIMEDAEAAVAALWQLRTLGVALALDDFGTGYSSLARLGDLPLDELKIDKSFVDRLGASAGDSTALVTAAVAMGHGLGLKVVAEGVETMEQATVLGSVGCDLLQGYLLGRPQQPEVLGALDRARAYMDSVVPQVRTVS